VAHVRELANEMSLISFGSNHTFRLPQPSTEAAKRFCSFKETMAVVGEAEGREGKRSEQRRAAHEKRRDREALAARPNALAPSPDSKSGVRTCLYARALCSCPPLSLSLSRTHTMPAVAELGHALPGALVLALLAYVWYRLVTRFEFTAGGDVHCKGLRASPTQRFVHELVRKGAGLVFVACWPLLYPPPSACWSCCYWAALVPLAVSLRLVLAGEGVWPSYALRCSLSRSCSNADLLLGPLHYGAIFTLATCIFWGRWPPAILSLPFLCIGDSAKAVAWLLVHERRSPAEHGPFRLQLPYNDRKSLMSLAAFVVLGTLIGAACLHLFDSFGWFERNPFDLPRILLVSLMTAVVDSFLGPSFVYYNAVIATTAGIFSTIAYAL